MNIEANATERDEREAVDLPLDVIWHVELADGVRQMSTPEVLGAVANGVIGGRTKVLRSDAFHWMPFERAKLLPPPSTDPLLNDSQPQSFEPGADFAESPHVPSVAPFAADVRPNYAPDPAMPPARFTGAFGPGNHEPASEVRTRRLVFAGVLTAAVVGGFFAATGTSGLHAIAARLHLTHAHAPESAVAAAPPPPAPPPPAPPPAPERPLAAPPPTGIAADSAKPPADQDDADKAAKKAKRKGKKRKPASG